MHTIIENLYKLDKLQKKASAIDLLFETVDDLCWAGKFSDIDFLMKNLDVTKISMSLMIGMLSITICIKNESKERNNFLDKVINEIIKRDRIDDIQGLLVGLD